jgi:hypothetical protein
MSDGTVFVAKDTFFYDGGMVSKGATVRAGHPLLEAHGDMFAPLRVDYEHEAPRAVKRAHPPRSPKLPGGEH